MSANAYAACPTGTTARNDQVEGKPVCTVKGAYLNSTLALTAGNAYVLEGDVRIGADNAQAATLTIEPGTTVYGSAGSFLVVMRGSKIFANGTAGKPVSCQFRVWREVKIQRVKPSAESPFREVFASQSFH